jgi:hypothetical protein
MRAPRTRVGIASIGIGLLAAGAAVTTTGSPAAMSGPPEQPARAAAEQVSPSGAQSAEAQLARLPLTFEANRGQTAARVDYFARAAGYDVWLTNGDAVLRTDGNRPSVLRMHHVGSLAAGPHHGVGRQPGETNYLVGDASEWVRGIPSYKRVRYEDVYPGIDLSYYGSGRQLEFAYGLAPGADPTDISIAFTGVRKLALDKSGDLILHTQSGPVRQRALRAFQGGHLVPSAYTLIGPRRVGFSLGDYDRDEPLVIDPVLEYSTYLGGSGWDMGYDIAVDATGSAYVTGDTGSPDFPVTPGAFQSGLRGAYSSAYVAKLNPAGTALVYSTYLGGTSGNTLASGIAVDGAGRAFVTGYVGGLGFPTTPGAFETELSGGFDAYVTKLTANGSGLVYSTFLGGDFDDFGWDIALDPNGNAVVTGEVHTAVPDPDFPIQNAFQPVFGGGGQDAFVTKLNAAGSGLVYSSYLGGGAVDLNSTADWGFGVAVDSSGAAYVTGYTFSFDFPTTPGAFDRSVYGLDGFVTKVAPAGAQTYSTVFGGTRRDYGWDIAVDGGGNAYVTGETESPDFPTTPGAFDRSGQFDAYVLKLNPAGSALVYSTLLGGDAGVDRAYGIAVSGGRANVTGFTESADFPTVEAFQPAFGGWRDAFVARLNPTGTALDYSSYLGGNTFDEARGIAVDGAGAAYLTGQTGSTDFPTENPLLGYSGEYDAFVTKVSAEDSPPPPDWGLSSLTLQPTTVKGGNPSRGTVVLTAPAPSGGVVVALTSSRPRIASVPASVTVPVGQTSRSFTITTKRPAVSRTATIAGSYGGQTRSAELRITR